MRSPRRGDVWWAELEEWGRRPFLVMTRSSVIPVLNAVVTAPLTRTVRSIPTELPLGPDEGLPEPCVATFDNLRTIPKAYLVDLITVLDESKMRDACRALRIAVDC